MSKRPINEKRARRLAKALRNTPPVYFDLADFLVSRKHAKSRREAREMMLEGRVRVDSHKVGFEEHDDPFKKDEKIKILVPHLRSELRDRVMVV